MSRDKDTHYPYVSDILLYNGFISKTITIIKGIVSAAQN